MIPQLQREVSISVPDAATEWSLASRIAFRFGFSYFLLYIYPRPVGSLGAGINYSNPLRDMWHAVVPWVGTTILHLTGNFTEVANGSGDQLYDYVLLFCLALAAMVATVIWSWVDRKRPNYEILYQWLRLFARMFIAGAMISYGANKLYRMQFAEPALARYIDTYGQTSPMGLLWVFMSTSRTYSLFGGIGEMLGGLLLIVPQFTALGSLVTLAVMSNVLMMNFCYDVPRKIYSIHLIAFCLFLLAPDIRRLLDLFVFNRKTQLAPAVPLFRDQNLNYGVWALQIFVGVVVLAVALSQAHRDADKAARHIEAPLRGIWAVDQFSVDNTARPPLLTDTQRWQYVIFDAPEVLTIQTMDGVQQKYYLQRHSGDTSFVLWNPDNLHWKATFTVDDSHPDRMALNGKFGDRQITASLNRVDMSDPKRFLLINRGMNWVNDYPHNR